MVIDAGVTARCVRGEAISLALLGQIGISRASQFGPDDSGQRAGMSHVVGPELGPFAARSEALAADAAWLEQHRLVPGQPRAAAGPAPP
jgi:hypothetical protein